MTIKEFLKGALHGLAVRIVFIGEAGLSEPVFGGTREQALECAYADYKVDAWEVALVPWITGRMVLDIFISMREEAAAFWNGGKLS